MVNPVLTRIFQAIGGLLLLTILVGCREPEAPLPPLIEVGARQVSLEQFEGILAQADPGLKNLPEKEQLLMKNRMVREIFDRELIAAEAARLKIEISPDELDTAMAEVRGTYTSEEFGRFLKDEGRSPEALVSALRLRLQTAKVTAAILKEHPDISDRELEDYYRQHKQDFQRPVEIMARQMLFRTRQDALKVRKLLKEGGDFATLAAEHSLSPDRENGGDLGYFAKGMLPREFDNAIFRLAVGQVSEPVQSPYGYHLFLVQSRRKSGLRPYEAVKEEILDLLKQQQEEQVFHDWLENLRSSTRIKVNWQLLDPGSTNHR